MQCKKASPNISRQETLLTKEEKGAIEYRHAEHAAVPDSLSLGTVLSLGPESHLLMQCRINAHRWSQPTFVTDQPAFIHFPWPGSVWHNRPKQLIQKQEAIFVN